LDKPVILLFGQQPRSGEQTQGKNAQNYAKY